MRERNDDASDSAQGSLAGGVGENASDDGFDDGFDDSFGAGFGDGAVDDGPFTTDADSSVTDGVADGAPFPSGGDVADDALGGTLDTGHDGGFTSSVDSFDDDALPDDEVADGGLDMDLSQPGQSHTFIDGIGFLVEEVHDIVFGDDHHLGGF